VSISESTQPTLPSPPHTRIRKVENFWKRRSLGRGRREGLGAEPGTHQDPTGATPGHPGQHLPQVRAPVHEVEDLGRVEELLELAQKFDALVVPTLGVDKGQERAGAG